MTDRLELAERCEKAEGPDRELDAEIAIAVFGFFRTEPRYAGGPVGFGYVDAEGSRVEPGHGGLQLVKPFTASIDAAMKLVPEGFAWVLRSDCTAQTFSPDMEFACQVRGGTPALALCAAALRAMEKSND